MESGGAAVPGDDPVIAPAVYINDPVTVLYTVYTNVQIVQHSEQYGSVKYFLRMEKRFHSCHGCIIDACYGLSCCANILVMTKVWPLR